MQPERTRAQWSTMRVVVHAANPAIEIDNGNSTGRDRERRDSIPRLVPVAIQPRPRIRDPWMILRDCQTTAELAAGERGGGDAIASKSDVGCTGGAYISRRSQSLEESPERINCDITRPAAAREISRRDNTCFFVFCFFFFVLNRQRSAAKRALFATAMPEIIADEE